VSGAAHPIRASRWRTLRRERGRVSLRVDVRALGVTGILAALAFALFVGNVAYGDYWVSPVDVLRTLVGSGPPGSDFIIVDLRLPRAIVAALAGAALALSGTIFQTLVRNPLASPDIIGITGGASLAGVSAFLLGSSGALVAPAAFAGALVATALLYALAWRSGMSPSRLVLVGIGISALCVSGISYLLMRGRIEEVTQAAGWLVGTVNNRLWEDVWPLAIGLIVLIPLVAAQARSLDALSLGQGTATALGVRVERSQLGLVAVGAALVALAVAAAGPIGFVALMAPNIARRLSRSSGSSVLPVSAATGAVLVLGADLAGRVAFGVQDLPVGIVTAILGAPFFLALLWRSNRIRSIA
jgi:iron complex transport system permease protein